MENNLLSKNKIPFYVWLSVILFNVEVYIAIVVLSMEHNGETFFGALFAPIISLYASSWIIVIILSLCSSIGPVLLFRPIPKKYKILLLAPVVWFAGVFILNLMFATGIGGAVASYILSEMAVVFLFTFIIFLIIGKYPKKLIIIPFLLVEIITLVWLISLTVYYASFSFTIMSLELANKVDPVMAAKKCNNMEPGENIHRCWDVVLRKNPGVDVCSLADNNSKDSKYKCLVQEENFVKNNVENQPILVNGRFIYIEQVDSVQLVVSDAAGQNKVILKKWISKDTYAYDFSFPSPHGSYYIYKNKDVYNLKGEIIFSLPERLLGDNELARWSNDERYLAITPNYYSDPKDAVVVYDVKSGKEIFRKRPDNLITNNYPFSTRAKAVWNDSNVLYFSDEKGVYQAKNFDSFPQVKFMQTTTPCYGITLFDDKELFCYKAIPQSTTKIFKYNILADQLNEPQFLSTEFAGGVSGDLYFLDDIYLLFVPESGGTKVINSSTGKIMASSLLRDSKYETIAEKSVQIFTDVYPEKRPIVDIPIKYLGN